MHHNADSYKVLGHLSTYGLLAPLDKDRKGRPLVDNKGISSNIVKHGGSIIPISTKRLSNKKDPVINPNTSEPLRVPKIPSSQQGAHSSNVLHVRPSKEKEAHHPPSRIPIHSRLESVRKAAAEKHKLFSNIAHDAHANQHVLQTGAHAQISRRKDLVHDKPLSPLPHEAHSHSHGHVEKTAHGSGGPYYQGPSASRSPSRQGTHTPHGGALKPAAVAPGHRAPASQHGSSAPHSKTPLKRPSSPGKRY